MADKNASREGLKTEAIKYLLNNGNSASRYDLAKHLKIDTITVNRLMRGKWANMVSEALGEYKITDADAAKRYIEKTGM
ncbi:MAG: hypothetical protein QXD77_00820 [Candidatus Aenigmatarchaeota archaeon]